MLNRRRVEYLLPDDVEDRGQPLVDADVYAHGVDKAAGQLRLRSRGGVAGQDRVAIPLIAQVHVWGDTGAIGSDNKGFDPYGSGAQEVLGIASRRSQVHARRKSRALALPHRPLKPED